VKSIKKSKGTVPFDFLFHVKQSPWVEEIIKEIKKDSHFWPNWKSNCLM